MVSDQVKRLPLKKKMILIGEVVERVSKNPILEKSENKHRRTI